VQGSTVGKNRRERSEFLPEFLEVEVEIEVRTEHKHRRNDVKGADRNTGLNDGEW
jgi:hypothetical protein